MKARISLLHKTEAEWQAYNNWVPAAGEAVIYSPDEVHNYSRIKIGDSETSLAQLPFIIDSAIDNHPQVSMKPTSNIIDGGRISEW